MASRVVQPLKVVLFVHILLASYADIHDELDISNGQAQLLQLTKTLQSDALRRADSSSVFSDVHLWVCQLGDQARIVKTLLLSTGSALKETFKSNLSHGSCPKGSICMPVWLVICLVIVSVVCAFYLVNYVLWSRRRVLQQLSNADSAKEHSEHGNFLGRLVEEAIEHFDQDIVGVDINFGSMDVNARLGTVEVHNLTIGNPKGYWSDYFLHAESVLVDIDMEAYVTSFGKKIIIEELSFKDVSACWERGFYSSNMKEMLDFLHQNDEKEPPKEPPKTKKEKPILKKVHLEGISMKIASYYLAGCGATLASPDQFFDNFSEEMKGCKLSLLPLLTTTLIQSILANVIGTEGAERILDGTSGICGAIFEAFSHLIMMIGYCLAEVFCCARRPKTTERSARKKEPPKPEAAGQSIQRKLTATVQAASDIASDVAGKVKQKTGCTADSGCMPCQALLESRRS